jgi:hypothetical protein
MVVKTTSPVFEWNKLSLSMAESKKEIPEIPREREREFL